MDFIFMLTRNDKTVSDCLHVIDLIEPLGLRHIGFKDVGVTEASAGELVNRIKARGATSYMEVVSTSPQAADRSIRTAAKIGVDRVLGGQEIETAMQVLPSDEARRLTRRDCRGLSSRSRCRLFWCRSARLPGDRCGPTRSCKRRPRRPRWRHAHRRRQHPFTGTDPGARGRWGGCLHHRVECPSPHVSGSGCTTTPPRAARRGC